MSERKKKPYAKPRLRRIELETKEVMGVGCKTSDGSVLGLGDTPCLSTPCTLDGS